MTAPTIDLPDTQIVTGRELTTHIARPCWVYAWKTTQGEDSWWSVYRSTLLDDNDHEWLEPVRDFIGKANLLHREIVVDPGMMFGSAELSTYAAA
jgi:hypothetical protein